MKFEYLLICLAFLVSIASAVNTTTTVTSLSTSTSSTTSSTTVTSLPTTFSTTTNSSTVTSSASTTSTSSIITTTLLNLQYTCTNGAVIPTNAEFNIIVSCPPIVNISLIRSPINSIQIIPFNVIQGVTGTFTINAIPTCNINKTIIPSWNGIVNVVNMISPCNVSISANAIPKFNINKTLGFGQCYKNLTTNAVICGPSANSLVNTTNLESINNYYAKLKCVPGGLVTYVDANTNKTISLCENYQNQSLDNPFLLQLNFSFAQSNNIVGDIGTVWAQSFTVCNSTGRFWHQQYNSTNNKLNFCNGHVANLSTEVGTQSTTVQGIYYVAGFLMFVIAGSLLYWHYFLKGVHTDVRRKGGRND